MPRAIIIRIECTDASDLDWLRAKCVPAVEEIVEENIEEARLDGEVSVTWEYQD